MASQLRGDVLGGRVQEGARELLAAAPTTFASQPAGQGQQQAADHGGSCCACTLSHSVPHWEGRGQGSQVRAMRGGLARQRPSQLQGLSPPGL